MNWDEAADRWLELRADGKPAMEAWLGSWGRVPGQERVTAGLLALERGLKEGRL